MTQKKFTIFAPLHEFDSQVNAVDLAPGVTIARHPRVSDWWQLEKYISEDERTEMSEALYWLTFSWEEGDAISDSEHVNLVLLALWMVKSSATHATFRFKIGADGNGDKGGVYRLLDRFQWVRGTVDDTFTRDELEQAGIYYMGLKGVVSTGGRLRDALLHTLFGCFAHKWQVAFICYAAAAETMLTYSRTGSHIKIRLSTAYACLVEVDATKRDAAFREFRDLYEIRSDIMHGRIYSVAHVDRLPAVGRFVSALRILWRTILSSPPLISALEGQDPQRAAHIVAAIAGYTPPAN